MNDTNMGQINPTPRLESTEITGRLVELKGHEWCKPNPDRFYDSDEVNVQTANGLLVLCRAELHHLPDGCFRQQYVPVKYKELNTVS